MNHSLSTGSASRKTKSDSALPQSAYHCSRAEVAKELGVSVQRVAQIERRALVKLRLILLARGMKKEDAMDLLNRISGESGTEYPYPACSSQ